MLSIRRDRSRMTGVAAVIVAAMAVPTTALAQPTLYVDDNAPLGGDGASWSTAFRYLQDALAVAEPSGGVPVFIRVAQGTYRPDQDEAGNVTPGDRAATFQLVDDVNIFGGHAGIGAPDPDEYNVLLYETILSGDLLRNDGADFQFNDENSYHVVTGNGTTMFAILAGFTVTAGNANVAPDDEGAGMYVLDGSPTVAVCTFTGNFASAQGAGMVNKNSNPNLYECLFIGNVAGNGGGMDNKASSPLLTGCRFEANEGSFGAGMRNIFGSNPELEECEFIDNDGFLGGGMYNYESSPILTGCLFSGNSATVAGGLVNLEGSDAHLIDCVFSGNSAGYGAGAYNSESAATYEGCTFGGPDPADGNLASATGGGMFNGTVATGPIVTGCVFTNNSADFAGGMFNEVSDAIVTDCEFTGNTGIEASGAMGNFSGSAPLLVGCTFTANTAPFGGAIRNYDNAAPVLIDCLFEGNVASDQGGGMTNVVNSTPTLTSCAFVDNSAGFGGAIRQYDTSNATLVNVGMFGNSATYAGGAITGSGAGPTLINCTLAGNTAGLLGGGIYEGVPVLANCVVWGNTNGQIETSSATVTFSDVQGGYSGSGNIDADPMFVDPVQGDYRLGPGSPCIDAGENAAVPMGITTDLEGTPRFVDDRDTPDCPQAPGDCGEPPVVDMGAYEFHDPCPWDLDDSGDVGITDFLLLLALWGTDPGGPPDFDGNGDVGVNDFLLLLAYWGPCV